MPKTTKITRRVKQQINYLVKQNFTVTAVAKQLGLTEDQIRLYLQRSQTGTGAKPMAVNA